MSAHGISPAWRQKNQFARGEDWKFDPISIHYMLTKCDIAFLGDVNPEIIIKLDCEVNGENPDGLNIISLLCSLSFLGDVNPTIVMNNVLVIIIATDP